MTVLQAARLSHSIGSAATVGGHGEDNARPARGPYHVSRTASPQTQCTDKSTSRGESTPAIR